MSRKHSYNNVPETRQCKSSLLLGVYIYRVPVSTQAVSPVVFVRLVVYFVRRLVCRDVQYVLQDTKKYSNAQICLHHSGLNGDNKWMK